MAHLSIRFQRLRQHQIARAQQSDVLGDLVADGRIEQHRRDVRQRRHLLIRRAGRQRQTGIVRHRIDHHQALSTQGDRRAQRRVEPQAAVDVPPRHGRGHIHPHRREAQRNRRRRQHMLGGDRPDREVHRARRVGHLLQRQGRTVHEHHRSRTVTAVALACPRHPRRGHPDALEVALLDVPSQRIPVDQLRRLLHQRGSVQQGRGTLADAEHRQHQPRAVVEHQAAGRMPVNASGVHLPPRAQHLLGGLIGVEVAERAPQRGIDRAHAGPEHDVGLMPFGEQRRDHPGQRPDLERTASRSPRQDDGYPLTHVTGPRRSARSYPPGSRSATRARRPATHCQNRSERRRRPRPNAARTRRRSPHPGR